MGSSMRGLTTWIAWTSLALVARADDTRLVTTVDGATPLGGDIVDASAEGRYVLFTSYSSAYVAGDTNDRIDLFVRDMELGTVERINVATDGSQEVGAETYYDDFEATMSADGRYVAFTTSGKLDPADKSDVDVYLRDRVAGTTTLVTHSTGLGGGDESFHPRMSRDGRFVVFSSSIPNLVPHDDNFMPDVFEWDRVNDTFTCASTDSTGKFQKSIAYFYPHVSGDGGIVTFDELMLRGDQPRWIGTFIKDLGAGSLEKLPIESVVALSGDGRIVLFTSGTDRDPADTNSRGDGYVFDRQASTYECVTFGTGKRSLAHGAVVTGMSDDGRRIAFTSVDDATGGGSGGLIDAFVYDRDTEVALRVSVGPDDERSQRDCVGGPISGDGHVAFFGTASDSLWPGDADSVSDVFARDLSAIPAAWTNYGSGLDGRFGVPSLTLSALPRRTTTVDLQVGNSSGLYTAAVLFVGVASASHPTSLCGTLLVDPLTTATLPLTPYDDGFPMTVPDGGNLPGVHVYLQVIELDPWAAKGVSFTPGLDATIGD
jgi:Tol biopolymer transport system component